MSRVRASIGTATALLLVAGIAGAQEGTSCAGSPDTAPSPIPAVTAPAAAARWSSAALFLIVVAIAVAGIVWVRAQERRRGAYPRPPWVVVSTPYWTGAALGALVAISLVAFDHPVGVSGGIQNLAGIVGHRLSPGTTYWGGVIPIGITWQVWVVIGVIMGASLSSVFARTFQPRAVPDVWRREFGPSVLRRWTVAFAAAALIEFASAIAGGCTSGLALSGGIALAPGAFLFMATMFATGIPSAFLVEKLARPR